MKTYNDKEKQAAANKKYYEKHKEERAEKARWYYIEHKEEYKERAHKYYIKNKESLSKKHKKYYRERKDKMFNNKQLRLLEITKSLPSLEAEQLSSDNNLENTRENIEACLLDALQIISTKTKYDDICRTLIEKAKTSLQYFKNHNH